MLIVVPGVPYFFKANSDSKVSIVSVSKGGGINQAAFRYSTTNLTLGPIDVGGGQTLPGVTFSVLAGRKRLGMVGAFLIEPPAGEFFFYEVVTDNDPPFLHLLGSVLPDDPRLSITIEGV